MKSNKRVWIGLGLAAVFTPLVLWAARSNQSAEPWNVHVRSVGDWFRPYHNYHVLTQANGTKAVLESKSFLAFALSRPLHGSKADQMIAFYEQFPKQPGQHHVFVEALRR